MKTSLKKSLFSFGTMGLLSCAFVPIISSCTTNNSFDLKNKNSNAKQAYVYDNKLFTSLDEIATYYISKNNDSVTHNYYLGDINKAVLDPTSLMLNINDLKLYDPNNMHPVYLNSLNLPTHDYETAKKSYVNKGLIDYQYYDFNNNLFPSYAEAKESIIKSKNASGVLYYNDLNINHNKKINFNPLSKKDLLKFKELAFNEALVKLNNKSNDESNFSLKIYDDFSNEKHAQIIDEKFIHNIILNAINTYFETKMKILVNSRFRVSVKLDDNGYGKNNFEIQGFSSYSSNVEHNDKTIIFKDVSFLDLKKFNMFINRDDFVKNSEIWIKKYALRHVSEEARIKLLDSTFKIIYVGDDWGGTIPWNSPDFRILQQGDETHARNYLSFFIDVEFENLNHSYKRDFKSQFQENLNSLLSNIKDDSTSISFIKHIEYNVVKNVFHNLFIKDNQFSIGSFNWIANTHKATMNNIAELQNYEVINNWFLKGNNYSYNYNEDCNLSYNNASYDISKFPNLKNISYNKEIINFDPIFNLIQNYLFNIKNLNFVIEYNNRPLFNFGVNLKTNLFNNELNYENSHYKLKINDLIFSNLSNFINELNFKEKQEFYNSFKNASQTFVKNNKTNTLFKVDNLFKLTFNNELIFNYDAYKEYQNIINPLNELVPELKDNINIKYQLNSLIPFYNKLVKQIKNIDPTNANKIINEQFNKPEDVVVLYKNDMPLSFIYKEYLSNINNIVANLIDNNAIKLVNSKNELKELIENNLFIEPAKVVVLYDLLGNVINPGIELNDDEKLSTTSDAIFDSSQTIIDNILRTKLVPKDITRVYWKDEFDNYHLVKNQVNRVYKLKLENNQYYFPTHASLMSQLKQYLNTKTERINYETKN